MALITVPTTADRHIPDKCQTCDGPTSITANPEDEESTEGVSLKNTLLQSPLSFGEGGGRGFSIYDILSPDFVQPDGYHWYFLRINYNRAPQFYNAHKDNHDGYLLWMPCQKNVTYDNGIRTESLDPIFSSNLFIYSTYDQAFRLTHHAADSRYPYVDFAYDHTRKNQYGRDLVITIPFRQMLQFIRAEHIHHPWAHVVPPEKIHFREGGKVLVTGGSFAGVEGHVARVFGQTRVIITIPGIVNYATAYVSQKYLQPITESEMKEDKPEAGNSIRNRVIRHELKMGYIPSEDKDKARKRKRKKTLIKNDSTKV